MTAKRIIAATFSDWRCVKGRKVLQLVFEVPIEQQTEVLTMLGPPGIAEDKWVAIALLNEKPVASVCARKADGSHASPSAPPQAPEPKERRAFHTLPLAQQCAMRVSERRFWHDYLGLGSPETADAWVKQRCGITSKAELGKGNHDSDNQWRKLNAEYEAWELDQRYADVRR